MRVVINKQDFSGIGTAVFYKKHKFFPEDINIIPEEERSELNFTSDLVKYHGSSNNFPSINFAEYDFSYLVNKYKFDNKLLITELDRKSQELIGKNIDDTNKIEKILFPTLIDSEEEQIKYFGSMKINDRNIFFFEIPNDYDKIEIYDDVLNSNTDINGESFIEYEYLELSGLYEETRIIPSIVIYLGPENKYLNNPTNMYYEDDPMRTLSYRREAGGERKSDVVYSRLIDEILGKKVVYLLLATNDTVIDFNIALSAWNNNDNSNRNKWKYNIRNDEYYNIKNNVGIVEEDNNIYLDKKSDTILGNYAITSSCPIKTKKLNRLYCDIYSETKLYSLGEEASYLNQIWASNISNNLGNYPEENSPYWTLKNKEYPSQYYSPYRKYMKGEITKYLIDPESNKYMVWESLVNDNINNDPLLSPSWILSKKFLDFETHIIYISTNPNNTGSILNPNTQITVNSASNVTFNIEEGLGYIYNSVNLIGPNNDIIDLEEGVDYTYTEINTEDEYSKSVNISDWSEIIDDESDKYSTNIVFNFVKSPSILNLKFEEGGTIYNLYEIQNLFTNGFNLNVYIGGVSYQIPENGQLTISDPETNPDIFINYSGELNLRKVISNYRIGSNFGSEIIPFSENSINNIVNFSEATYTFYLESRKREILIRIKNNKLLMNGSYIENYDIENQSLEVNYGDSYILTFFAYNSPVIYIDSFYRNDNNEIVKNENTLDLTNYPQYNAEVIGNGDTTLINFERLEEDGTFKLSTNSVNNNLIIYLE